MVFSSLAAYSIRLYLSFLLVDELTSLGFWDVMVVEMPVITELVYWGVSISSILVPLFIEPLNLFKSSSSIY